MKKMHNFKSCNQCDEIFTTARKLKIHNNCEFDSKTDRTMKVHLGKCRTENFECGLCESTFKELNDL
jgi:hypothetical protein